MQAAASSPTGAHARHATKARSPAVRLPTRAAPARSLYSSAGCLPPSSELPAPHPAPPGHGQNTRGARCGHHRDRAGRVRAARARTRRRTGSPTGVGARAVTPFRAYSRMGPCRATCWFSETCIVPLAIPVPDPIRLQPTPLALSRRQATALSSELQITTAGPIHC